MRPTRAVIFDLDGVLVDTARHHRRAWDELAAELGFELDTRVHESLKGVSRQASLDLVLAAGGRDLDPAQRSALAERKNARYLELVDGLTPDDVLPGVERLLGELARAGVRVAVGSASKNAQAVLARLGLTARFDAVVDGLCAARPKPAPDVFLAAARELGEPVDACVVVEDAAAGVEAAHRAGMRAVGIGDAAILAEAEAVVPSPQELTTTLLGVRPTPETVTLHGVELTAEPFHLDEAACHWVQQTHAGLTLEQKVGQLFFLVAVPADAEALAPVLAVAEPAGFMHRPGTADSVAALSDRLQRAATVPMVFAANIESGTDGLATDATSFGSALQVAATDDPLMAYRMGQVAGREARALGCTWGFSPIADIQLNLDNPITNTRAFGSDPARVARMTIAFIRGLQNSGVAAATKHWPGDGVDDRDQHLVTSINALPEHQWDESFGRVYREAIEAGTLAVMVGHIALPAYSRALRPELTDEEIMPATLAPELTTTLLREHLGFRGLTVSDASTMAGLQIPMPRRDLVPAVINAGCDVFLFSTGYAEDYGHLLEAVRSGRVTQRRLDEAVARVLAFKAAVGAHEPAASAAERTSTGSPTDRYRALPLDVHAAWARESAERAVTLVKDREPGVLPLTPTRFPRVLVYSLTRPGDEPRTADAVTARLCAEGFHAHRFVDPEAVDMRVAHQGTFGAVTGAQLLADWDLVLYVADIAPASNEPTVRLAWTPKTAANVPKYVTEIPTVFVSFGSPFHLRDVPRVRTFINAYGHNAATVQAVVDALLGRLPFVGTSPVDPFCGYWDTRL